MRDFLEMFALLIGLATLAVLVSTKANTVPVIGAISGAVANTIGAAVSPVTGSSITIQTGGNLNGLNY